MVFKCIKDEYKYISKCRALACFPLFGIFVSALHFVSYHHSLVVVSLPRIVRVIIYQSVLYHSLTFVFSNSADAATRLDSEVVVVGRPPPALGQVGVGVVVAAAAAARGSGSENYTLGVFGSFVSSFHFNRC